MNEAVKNTVSTSQQRARERAHSRLSQYRAASERIKNGMYEKGSIVKPVRVSKDDPSVKRMLTNKNRS